MAAIDTGQSYVDLNCLNAADFKGGRVFTRK